MQAMTTLVTHWLRGFVRRTRTASKTRAGFGGDPKRPVVVYVAANVIEADLVKALLASEGIDAFVANVAASQAYGIQIGKLAECRVLVPADIAPRARQIIEERHLRRIDEDAEEQ
jgi:hypothetical protein